MRDPVNSRAKDNVPGPGMYKELRAGNSKQVLGDYKNAPGIKMR